jgi:hypothetical protein
MQFADYPAERLAIDPLVSRLTPAERQFRKRLIDYTIRHQKPVNLHDPLPDGLQGPGSKQLTEALISKKVVAAADNGDINFMYPVSAVPTPHQVQLQDGRQLFAMCAVDALGTAFTFGQDVRVTSKCSECGQPVSVAVHNGRVMQVDPQETQVLHVDLNKFENWPCST